MPDKPSILKKPTLDKDLDKLTTVEDIVTHVSRRLVAPGLALMFLGCAMLVAGIFVFDRPGATLGVAAAALAAYMAMNIGAKDVANNVGAAVGARAITMTSALVMAAIFEILGAVIAGGPVVMTISSSIVDAAGIADVSTLSWLMMAALFSAAAWINLATWLRAPVSTTHAIVGAVMGAGAAAAGPRLVNWHVMAAISAGWVITPLLGGVIAALILFFIKTSIIYRDDKIAAATYWIPILIGVMAGAFTVYLVVQLAPKGSVSSAGTLALGAVCAVLAWLAARPVVLWQSRDLENKNSALRKLFRLPLVGAAALMSFAHGANDVANAIGPLTAIVQAGNSKRFILKDGATFRSMADHAPFWVVLIGAFGISLGILLYGPRLIRLIGEQITKLNPMRAYCVSLSAAVTVIIASWFGLPVSSTHIAVGAVFGVGFFREWYTRHSKRRIAYLRMKAEHFEMDEPEEHNPDEVRRRHLVRRSHFMTIIAAWIVTVPISGALAAVIYWTMVTLFT
jgi:PiT family inorganic phosphate transporter